MADVFTVTGIEEHFKSVQRFVNPHRGKVIKHALDNAARILQSVAVSLCTIESGNLAKSIVVKNKYYKNTDTHISMVGPRSWAMKQWNGKTRISHKYAHLADKGRDEIEVKEPRVIFINGFFVTLPAGRIIPRATGTRYMQKAYNGSKARCLASIANDVNKGMGL